MKFAWISFLLIIASPVEWHSSFDAAKKLATENRKMMLLNFSGSDWCAPCIKMKTEVFENADFLSIAEKNLILGRADFPRTRKNQLPQEQIKQNEALAEKYNRLGKFPYTLLLDANGRVIRAWDGYTFGSHAKFIDQLTSELSVK